MFDYHRRNCRHERFVVSRQAALRNANRRPPTASPCEEETSAREIRAAINRVVEALPPADRDLWERLCNGESHQQIADATGRTVPAVKQAAYRIRLRIQNGLPEEYRLETRTEKELGDV